MQPNLIKGGHFSDHRGVVTFNNGFDATQVSRIYCIQNIDQTIKRGWQGHRIEQRWFCAINGTFQIDLIQIDNWEEPSKDLTQLSFTISAETMEILFVPAGYITCLKAMADSSKLLVMADRPIGVSNDEYRFDLKYFKKTREEHI